MSFHGTYQVKPGDNLSKIAKSSGFANPGPIVAYPPNAAFFRGRSPNLIRPGESFMIPYHPDLLKKIIATSEYLMEDVAKSATAFINKEYHNKQQIDEFLYKIDAIKFLANVGVGIAQLTARGAQGAAMTTDEVVQWFVNSRITIASNVATMSIPSPTAPKKDFKFYVRHALGPWNPSYWATVYGAIKTGDVDLYLYGTDALTHRNAMKIKAQAEKDIENLKQRVAAARAQLHQPFYMHRI
jgi:hypothetical protein